MKFFYYQTNEYSILISFYLPCPFFRRPVEILTNHFYTLGSNFSYVDPQNQDYEKQNLRLENDQKYQPIETVWGGGGEKMINVIESKSKFHFEKISRHDVRSSWANGQIPILYYI